tara:strand:+ start:486 stop:608 length:123 start_codon:yes stop_codon:yes gene_type:complete
VTKRLKLIVKYANDKIEEKDYKQLLEMYRNKETELLGEKL